ncbi:CD209 antigen-like protein C [Anolis sagrei]|uniref:CD209 antigen-like protein C n=1 Tax=Anolis sagrei TaxID=38937 RepID=UPI0035223A19
MDMILLSQHAAMFSEFRKMNFTPTTEICEPSIALLNIEELKSTFIAKFRTLENYIDQKYEASDRKMEGEISRLDEELSAMKNRQVVCPTPKPLQWEKSGDSYYYFSNTAEHWEEAKKLCAAANSYLIIINSRTEQDFVVQKIKQSSVWLGLSDTEVERTWRWVDGSLLQEHNRALYEDKGKGEKGARDIVGYWRRGEPNNAGNVENCAVLYKEKNWNDIPCDKNVHFVCEKSALN